MTNGTGNVENESGKVMETVTVNAGDEGLMEPQAKAAGKEKSKAERTVRKTRRAKALEEQARKDQGAKADGQNTDAPAGDGTEKDPEGETGPGEGNAGDQVEDLEKTTDPKDSEDPANGSDSSEQQAAPRDGARKGYKLRKAHKKRKNKSYPEDVPPTSEMWQMIKDMMTQVSEIRPHVALVARLSEPGKRATAPGGSEVARPAKSPEKRGTSPRMGREYRECLLQIEKV